MNSEGRRFVNESENYHDFVEAMFRSHKVTPTIPAWLICDRTFIRDYGIGMRCIRARASTRSSASSRTATCIAPKR